MPNRGEDTAAAPSDLLFWPQSKQQEELMERFARRSVIAGAGVGLVSLAAGARAETKPEIQASEYWAQKGDVKLYMYRKRTAAKAGEKQPVLFLVHGSSISSRPSFDLAVPGYSTMDDFASHGFDVWTMDHENYGRSSRTNTNSDIASGAADLKAAADVVARETGQSKFHYLGESSGAIRAGMFAQQAPEHVEKLVLCAFTYKGTGSAEMARRASVIEKLRAKNTRLREQTMIRSIFTRDKLPGAYDVAVADAIWAAEQKFGDQVPAGTYVDMAANLPLVDPKKVPQPVLMLRGEYDGNSTNEDLLDFYTQLPNGDRQYVILPQTAHSLGFAKNRHLLFYAVRNFLAAPAAFPAA
jgi:alpha-beta hydrolase superfamily lysophospholipase